MESTQQERQQEQSPAGPSRQPPLSPIEEEAVAGLSRMNKRSRENPVTIDDSSDDERGVKRRQTQDSRDDAVEAAAGTAADAADETIVVKTEETSEETPEDSPETATETSTRTTTEESDEQIEKSTNEETTLPTANPTSETNNREKTRRKRVLAAYIERTNTREASYDGASTWNSSHREPSGRGASNGNPSTRHTSPQAEDHGEADDEKETESVPYWRTLLSRGQPESSTNRYPISEADSECFALPRPMWPKEHKDDQFRDPSWGYRFQEFGIFLYGHPQGFCEESEVLCKELLKRYQSLPENSLFDEDIVGEACKRIHQRNETMIFRDMTPLIAPSAELLALRGETHANLMCESTNEIWSSSQPVLRIQPQPTYAVGFAKEAFTIEQYTNVTEFIESICGTDTSPILGIPNMLLPFFSCEVGTLSMSQRQNAHNMTVGMHGVVELFRSVKREAELHRKILGFSISHTHRQVQIEAHYPVILGDDTNYFQEVIHSFDFAAPDCRDRWAAYRFTRNMYDRWVPAHLSRIRSAMDDLPRMTGQMDYVCNWTYNS